MAALLLATLIAIDLRAHSAGSLWNTVGVAALLLVAQPLLLVTVSFLITRVSGPTPAGPGKGRYALRALVSETLQFIRTIFALCAEAPGHAAAASASPTGEPARAVLLIHGILCNRAVWSALEDRLALAGYSPVSAVNLEPLFADLDAQASRLMPELLALQRQSHGAAVTIVCHSMGGLVARALLRKVDAGAIDRIITIATPHHGTAFARGLPWPALRQMAPGSVWLQGLNEEQEGRFSVPLHSIYSLEDNLIMPALSASLQGSQQHIVRGVGHLGLLRHIPVLDYIVSALPGLPLS